MCTCSAVTLGYMLSRRQPWLAGYLSMESLEPASPTSAHERPERLLTSVEILREVSRGNRPRLDDKVPIYLSNTVAAAVADTPQSRPTFRDLSGRLRGWAVARHPSHLDAPSSSIQDVARPSAETSSFLQFAREAHTVTLSDT